MTKCVRDVLLICLSECREYCAGLREILEALRERRVCYRYVEVGEEGFIRGVLAAVAEASGHDTVHLCGYPSHLILPVFFLLLTGGLKRVVISIPPLPANQPLRNHHYPLLFLGWILFMHRLRGRSIRFVVPSPLEGMLVHNAVHWAKRVYIPAFFVAEKKPRYMGKIDMDKIVILAYIGDEPGDFLGQLVENLADVEIPARILLLNPSSCPSHPFVSCIAGSPEAVMERVSIVYIPTAHRESSRVLLEALMNGKPVITGRRLGLALLHQKKGLVILLENPYDTEHVTSAILDFVNKLDDYRRILINYEFHHPKPRDLAAHLRYLAYD